MPCFLLVAVGVETSQGAAVVPQELQVILENPDQKHRDQVVKKINCLLYLCLFPPTHHVRTEDLVRRWLAEGLVEQEKDAAENLLFFDKCIIRSFQTSNYPSSKKKSNYQEVETCQHTSQMHAWISQKSKFGNFVLVCDGTTSILKLPPRRLSVHVHPSPNVQLNLPRELSRVRTLAVFPADKADLANYGDVLDFSRYKLLRVLDLKEFAHLTPEDADKILDDVIVNHRQVLMKYLSMNLGSAKGISEKIVNLNQLETLDLSGSDNPQTVFKEVLLLPRMKYLLGKFEFSRRETVSMSDSDLKEFLSKKSVLETLQGFVTGRRYGFPDLMSYMRCLRKVKIWCKPGASKKRLGLLSSAITEFIRRGSDELQCVRSLSIDFTECSTEFVIKIAPAAAGKLDSLELQGKLSQFPQFVAGLSAVVELCLCSTGLSWEVIQDGLKNVRGLKYLKLVEDNLGHFDVDIIPQEEAHHLRSIERVSVVSSPRLDITIPDEALPLLVSLRIVCQALDVSPASSVIKISHMEKLQEITLHLDVKPAIRTKWEDAARAHPHNHVRVTEGP